MISTCFPTITIQYVSGFRKQLPTGVSCTLHAHQGFEIVYHPSGRGETCIDDNNVIEFAAGSCIIYPPLARHIQSLSVPGEDICLLFVSRMLTPPEVLVPLYIPELPFPATAHDLLALAAESLPISPEHQRSVDYRMTIVVYTLWHAALSQLPAGSPRLHPYVDSACRYMRSRYKQIQRVGEIAEYVGVSEDHLRHLFRAECGMSMRKWLNVVRIERAKELLTHFSLPLHTIAELCGFENERYFSTVFSSIVGSAPGAYRKGTCR